MRRRERDKDALQGPREETSPEDVLDRELLHLFTFLLLLVFVSVGLTDPVCRGHHLRVRDLAERRVLEQFGDPRDHARSIGPVQSLCRSGRRSSTGTEHVDPATGDRLAQGSVVQVVKVREERRPQGAQFDR